MNEEERLSALNDLSVLYTPNEERYESITHLLAHLFSVKICGIALIDRDTVWIKSMQGLTENQISRNDYLSQHSINTDEVFIIEDATKDESFKLYPWVSGPEQVRFYASTHIKMSNGCLLGDIFIADSTPRSLNEEEKDLLKDIAALVLSEILHSATVKKSHH